MWKYAWKSLIVLLLTACVESPAPETGKPLPPLPKDLQGPVLFKGTADGRWTKPGLDPFKGDLASALTAQGVPLRTQAKLMSRMAKLDYDDRVCADRFSVLALKSHVVYWPGMAMTFGTNEIRYNMTAAFDGAQCGLLYIEDGFHEWVPYVCGNPTRLMPFYEASAFARSNRPDVLPGIVPWWSKKRPGIGDRRGQPYQPLPEGFDVPVHQVPEPSILYLLIIGTLTCALFLKNSNALTTKARRTK